MFILNTNRRKKIQLRVRARVQGTDARPRLSVFKSNKHVYAQIINDDQAVTLAAASSLTADLKGSLKGKTPSERAIVVGKHIAEMAKEKGINTVVFDRNGYRYHGIVKALADAAREAGLVF
jgi:large subunit ribosomal protein L18